MSYRVGKCRRTDCENDRLLFEGFCQDHANGDYKLSAKADANRQTPDTQELELGEILKRTDFKGDELMVCTFYPEANEFGWTPLEQVIEQNYISKDKLLEALPKSYKHKVGLDVALLWDSQDATDGYNQALRDCSEALGLGEVKR